MAMALLVIIVGALLGALMLPMMLTQAQSTRFDTTRVQSLHAAQAGVDVVLGQIRASTTTDARRQHVGQRRHASRAGRRPTR